MSLTTKLNLISDAIRSSGGGMRVRHFYMSKHIEAQDIYINTGRISFHLSEIHNNPIERYVSTSSAQAFSDETTAAKADNQVVKQLLEIENRGEVFKSVKETITNYLSLDLEPAVDEAVYEVNRSSNGHVACVFEIPFPTKAPSNTEHIYNLSNLMDDMQECGASDTEVLNVALFIQALKHKEESRD